MRREYYSDSIAIFLEKSSDEILGELVRSSNLDGATLERTQSEAWLEQIRILKEVLGRDRRDGKVYFEYSIPRLGRRIDVVLLMGPVIFVLEFKVYEEVFKSYGIVVQRKVGGRWRYGILILRCGVAPRSAAALGRIVRFPNWEMQSQHPAAGRRAPASRF